MTLLARTFDYLHNWTMPVLSAWPEIGLAGVLAAAGMCATCGYLARRDAL